VTYVAARVKGQVTRALVDDNNRVRKGDLLVQLDKEPFQVAVKKAAVDTATADLEAANARVRGIEGRPGAGGGGCNPPWRASTTLGGA
jgi:membrane fusion protein, multidrug efflux system